MEASVKVGAECLTPRANTARQLWIPLPPLAVQKRIAAKVEELLSDVERLKKGAA